MVGSERAGHVITTPSSHGSGDEGAARRREMELMRAGRAGGGVRMRWRIEVR